MGSALFRDPQALSSTLAALRTLQITEDDDNTGMANHELELVIYNAII